MFLVEETDTGVRWGEAGTLLTSHRAHRTAPHNREFSSPERTSVVLSRRDPARTHTRFSSFEARHSRERPLVSVEPPPASLSPAGSRSPLSGRASLLLSTVPTRHVTVPRTSQTLLYPKNERMPSYHVLTFLQRLSSRPRAHPLPSHLL